MFRLPQYIRRIKGGAVNVRPNIRVVREAAGMALVDGDNGMGHLVMRFATEIAIEKAKHGGRRVGRREVEQPRRARRRSTRACRSSTT